MKLCGRFRFVTIQNVCKPAVWFLYPSLLSLVSFLRLFPKTFVCTKVTPALDISQPDEGRAEICILDEMLKVVGWRNVVSINYELLVVG